MANYQKQIRYPSVYLPIEIEGLTDEQRGKVKELIARQHKQSSQITGINITEKHTRAIKTILHEDGIRFPLEVTRALHNLISIINQDTLYYKQYHYEIISCNQ